ncbi:MAG: hypothetical protein H7A37_03225 [Chlamydiales bacterium]|nr:hypothetical protein [Chlamydiia bacterium]MCP5507298.1 hypothetical protein [Chlamydiales bacterium]
MKLRSWITAFLLSTASLGATDFQPWYPRDLEIQTRFLYAQQRYDNVDTITGSVPQRSTNNFFGAGVEVAYTEWCGEVELMTSQTLSRAWSPEYLRATARYQLMDDVIGDPVSLVVGATGTYVFGQSIKDIAVFHQCRVEGELHLAVGKEYSTGANWIARAWALGAVGGGEHGAAWYRGLVVADYLYCLNHELRVFVEGLHGNGSQALNLSVPFNGYGTINYETGDVGGRYSYYFDFYGSFSFTFAYRFYAKNCPEYAKTYAIEFLYPFGL